MERIPKNIYFLKSKRNFSRYSTLKVKARRSKLNPILYNPLQGGDAISLTAGNFLDPKSALESCDSQL